SVYGVLPHVDAIGLTAFLRRPTDGAWLAVDTELDEFEAPLVAGIDAVLGSDVPGRRREVVLIKIAELFKVGQADEAPGLVRGDDLELPPHRGDEHRSAPLRRAPIHG